MVFKVCLPTKNKCIISFISNCKRNYAKLDKTEENYATLEKTSQNEVEQRRKLGKTR